MLSLFENVQELDPIQVDFLNHSYMHRTVIITMRDDSQFRGVVKSLGAKNISLKTKKENNRVLIIPISQIYKINLS